MLGSSKSLLYNRVTDLVVVLWVFHGPGVHTIMHIMDHGYTIASPLMPSGRAKRGRRHEVPIPGSNAHSIRT